MTELMTKPTNERTTARYLTADATKFAGGCRWCDGAISPPRRTFCSAKCVHEHKLRSSGSYLRTCVYRRDRAVCVICNFDTKTLAKALRVLTVPHKRTRVVPAENAVQYTEMCAEYGISMKRKTWGTARGGGLWDADHIVRVVDGGGCAGLDNVRTLCCSCHKAVTWAARPLAKKTV